MVGLMVYAKTETEYSLEGKLRVRHFQPPFSSVTDETTSHGTTISLFKTPRCLTHFQNFWNASTFSGRSTKLNLPNSHTSNKPTPARKPY